jgi:hypothetical protein
LSAQFLSILTHFALSAMHLHSPLLLQRILFFPNHSNPKILECTAHLLEQPKEEDPDSSIIANLLDTLSLKKNVSIPLKLKELVTKFPGFHQNLHFVCICKEHELLHI